MRVCILIPRSVVMKKGSFLYKHVFHKHLSQAPYHLLASYKFGLTLFKNITIHWHLVRQSSIGQLRVIPESVFQTMPKSQQTLTRHVTKMADFIQTENIVKIRASPCWGIQMDDGTDKGDFVQAGNPLFRYADMELCCITTKFLTIPRVEGSPNADNIAPNEARANSICAREDQQLGSGTQTEGKYPFFKQICFACRTGLDRGAYRGSNSGIIW